MLVAAHMARMTHRHTKGTPISVEKKWGKRELTIFCPPLKQISCNYTHFIIAYDVFICYRAPNQIFVILFERNYCGGRIELF
jgi:hypothetical protein